MPVPHETASETRTSYSRPAPRRRRRRQSPPPQAARVQMLRAEAERAAREVIQRSQHGRGPAPVPTPEPTRPERAPRGAREYRENAERQRRRRNQQPRHMNIPDEGDRAQMANLLRARPGPAKQRAVENLSSAQRSIYDRLAAEEATLVDAIDLFTGVRTFIEHPSWENAAWVAANVVPFKLAAAPILGPTRGAIAAGRAARAGESVRTIAREGFSVALPPAGSRTGRAIERAMDRVMPRGLQLRQIALESARTRRIEAKVMRAEAAALQKLRLRAPEEVALRLAAEGGSLESQMAYYASRARDGRIDETSRLYHSIHADLIKQASKWLENGPFNTIFIKENAPQRIKTAWRLLAVTGKTREEIYRKLGKLTDSRMGSRINAPGRVIQGAKWLEPQRVTDELAGTDVLPGGLVGAEDFVGGQLYIAERMGVPGLGSASGRGPFRARIGSANPRTLIRQAQANLSGGRGRAIAGIERDASLSHAYTGWLKNSGFYRTDVSNVAADSLATALKLDSIRSYRDDLLQGASDVYKPGYVAIKDTPSAKLSGELKELWAKLELIESGGLTPKSMKHLGLADKTLPERLAEFLFSPPTSPTAGVKWVPAELVSQRAIGNLAGKTFKHPTVMRSVGAALDLYNDLQRAAILYLNPAYGPVNLVGNTVMNLFQQGVFYPANIVRANQVFRGLSPEGLATARALVGTGMTRAIGTAGTVGAKQVTRSIGDLIQMGSDSMPRWTAFVHAAREFPHLKTAKDFDNLFAAARAGDQDSMDAIVKITRKANDAIIDYERLTPWEQEVASKIIFFYPFLKGATRYTYRFPLEHPVQTAALAGAGYAAHDYAQDQLGAVSDRPFYTQWDIPIPGMEDAKGNPYVLGIRQLLTFTVPIELGEAAYSFVTGNENLPQVLDNLTPIVSNIIVATTGQEPLPGGGSIDVGKGLPTFFKQSIKDKPPQRLFEGIRGAIEGEDRSDWLYPRTLRDELIRVAGGGLAPKPLNVGEALDRPKSTIRPNEAQRERLTADRPGTPEQRAELDRLNRRISAEFPRQYQESAREALNVEYRLDRALDDAYGRDRKMDYEKAAAIILDFLHEYVPESAAQADDVFSQITDAEMAEKFYNRARTILRERMPWSEVKARLEKNLGG